MKQTREITKRIGEITQAWTEEAPEAKLAGMTVAEFQTAVAPSAIIRAEMSVARSDIKGKVASRHTADAASRDVLSRVVAAVIADAAYGANSSLYRRMNYLTKDERASGLVRKVIVAAPVTAPTA